MKIQLLKSKWMVLFGMSSSFLAMTYTLLLFFIGTRARFVPMVFYSNADIRNIFITGFHSLSVIFAIIYFLSFFNNKYNSKIVSLGTFNIVLFLLGIVLVFRCYFINDVEALIFVMTINGILMTIFLWLLSILKYDVIDPVTSKSSLLNLWLKIFTISGLFAFIFAVLTYYKYTIVFLLRFVEFKLAPVTIDAISIFLYIIGNIFILISFVIIFFCEVRLKKIIRKLRSSSKEN